MAEHTQRGDRVRATWPPERWPTADEWRDWFLDCPRWQQGEIATKIVDAADRSARCFEQNHDALPELHRDLAARLARVEAPADEWERNVGNPVDWAPTSRRVFTITARNLRAALAGEVRP